VKSLNPEKSKGSRLYVVLLILLVLGFFFVIWFPELKHYYVPLEKITVAMTARGRSGPSDEVLEELRAHRLLEHDWSSDAQLVETAERLLKGSVKVAGLPEMNIHLPFDPSDLDKGPSQWQLQFSGFIVPEVLIDAYRVTGRQEFYVMARNVILAWAKYEKSAWLNRGFLWNDHAVATRVRTLADFWSIYRHRPDYQPEVAEQIWEFAARTGALLAKPDQYTFATNHGVMQNIALWQVSLAFPFLPRAEEYKQLALFRLDSEITFYIAPDGVVLEHSADYHEFGLFLFGVALRYTTLLQLNVPLEWDRKYENAKQFYAELRRPDASLPPFGDSAFGLHHKVLRVTHKDDRGRYTPLVAAEMEVHSNHVALYQVSGYGILWDGPGKLTPYEDLSQTVLLWSFYPGHGHKHADEPSVLLWAGGQDWWTNAGYWPYDHPDRIHAECFEASNAPHLDGEKCNANRRASLIASLDSSKFFAAEIERWGPGDLKIRRLVVHERPSVWVIVDECTGAAQDSLQTIWTTAPNVKVENGPTPAGRMFSSDKSRNRLLAYFLGPPSLTINNYSGSRNPFAGWISLDGKPTLTNAIVTSQPAEGAWAVTVWVTDKDSLAEPAENSAASVEWGNRESWTVQVQLKAGSQSISRDGERISIKGVSSSPNTHFSISGTLEPAPPDLASRIAALDASYRAESARYPHFRDLSPYRVRASVFGMALLAIQELFLAIYRRLSGKFLLPLRVLALVGWVGLCYWVPIHYLSIS
jgi:hypothetical protein